MIDRCAPGRDVAMNESRAAHTLRWLDATEAEGRRDELVALTMRSKASWGYHDDFMARFGATSVTRNLVDAGRDCVVAFDGHRAVGFAVLDDEKERAWLEDLWVEPGYFGRGVGRALVGDCVKRSRDWGRRVLELESDPHAEGFYLRLGAVRVGERASAVASDRNLPLMRLDLARYA